MVSSSHLLCILCYSHLLIHFPYDLRNSRTAVRLTELVNHNFIENAAMTAKRKVPAVFNHYEVPETLPA